MPEAAKDLSPAAALRMLDEGAVLIDVRERRELEVSSFDFAGVVNIPLSEFQARWREVPEDQPAIIACAVGARSLQAANFLRQHGYTQVSNLIGGIARWGAEGLPVRRS